jgi:hypothetical protein
MNEQRFDALARALAEPRARRAVVAGIIAMLTGGRQLALAACNEVGQNCDKDRDCCDHAE